MVMADRGFQLHEELLLRFCSLQAPPGARAKSQMTTGFMLKEPLIESTFSNTERGYSCDNATSC